MPRGIPNKPKKTSKKKVTKRQYVSVAATPHPKAKRTYTRKPKVVEIELKPTPLEDLVGTPTIIDSMSKLSDAIIGQRMEFNGNIDPSAVLDYKISEARYAVRHTAAKMSDAARAVATNNDPAERFVLKARADLAGAEFDRALVAFEKILRG